MKKLQEKKSILLKLFNEEVSVFNYNEQDKINVINDYINTTLATIIHIKNKLDEEYNKIFNDKIDIFAPLVFTKRYKELKENLNDLKLELEAFYMIKHIELMKEV